MAATLYRALLQVLDTAWASRQPTATFFFLVVAGILDPKVMELVNRFQSIYTNNCSLVWHSVSKRFVQVRSTITTVEPNLSWRCAGCLSNCKEEPWIRVSEWWTLCLRWLWCIRLEWFRFQFLASLHSNQGKGQVLERGLQSFELVILAES